MSKLLELSAIFDFERHRFENSDGDVVIADARLVNGSATLIEDPIITVKGKADLDELKRHQTYRFYGRWANYENKRSGKTEKQFHFQTFVEAAPHGRPGIIAYLKRAGEGNNIGHATATKIYEKFAGDSVRILREQPEVIAAAVKRLKIEDCESAAKWLKDRQALENCTIEINNLLDGRGFPKDTTRKVIREWGNEAAERIKRDPFVLMNFRGCGFKRCDNLYIELGLDPAKLRRQAFCAWYAVASNHDGHTWFPAQVAARGVAGMVGSNARPKAAIKMAKRIGRMDPDSHGALSLQRESGGVIVQTGSNVFVSEGRKAWCEDRIATIVAEKFDSYTDQGFWIEANEVEGIDEHQQEELEKALSGPIGILGGSPGTGKTYTAARLVAAMAEKIGWKDIALAAPTGKAAVRLTEAMAEYGLTLAARTWHSLLGVGQSDSESGNWAFDHNESNPFDYKLIIGDESSMNDTNLMSSIMRAIPENCHLLLIGDINQLPPVGHGAPLRDLIAAGLPYGELTEIKRNSGGIVEACAAIRDGKEWLEGDNLKIAHESKPSNQFAKLDEELCMAEKLDGLDRVWDCQVLVAVNEKSQLSRKAVNKHLQSELNKNPAIKGTPFRLADKIVNLKNSSFTLLKSASGPAGKDEKAYVANGELGKVIEVSEKFIDVEIQSPFRVVRVPRGKAGKDGTGCSWDLGYALSCHKSQGSEWPVVIVMIDEYPGAKMVCSREWLYTAISRAKRYCVLIGKKSIADSMCTRTAINKRKTFLRELICLKRAKLELVEL